jgi:hypothetical protein
MATDTAVETYNKMFRYDKVFYNVPLSIWVTECHKYMCDQLRVMYYKPTPGSFDYDTYAIAIGIVLNDAPIRSNLELLNWLHMAKKICYFNWSQNLPYEKDSRYIKPDDPLGDPYRTKLFNLNYESLPESERNKYIIMAQFILSKVPDLFNKRNIF